MEGVGRSALLRFFVDNTVLNNTMSERSPTIESQAPTLQQLRSVTETTLDTPEWDDTADNDSEAVVVEVKSRDAKAPVTEETENTIYYDKKSFEAHTEEKCEEKDENGDFTKSPDIKEKANLTDEKDPDVTNSATEENAVASKDDFVYSPVITVTKEESTLTKGDLKLQKVVVSEDISDESTFKNRTTSVTQSSSANEARTDSRGDVLSVPTRTDQHTDENIGNQKTDDGDQKDSKKIQTKIPKLMSKQAAERVTKEKQDKRKTHDPEQSIEQKRRSSIPRLKDFKNPPQDNQKDLIQNKKVQEVELPKIDDEFDKIYEEIIESEASNNIPSPEKIINPIKLESKFEEIIHAYDENNVQPITTEKTKSKIPLLKRKSEQEIEIPPPNHRKYSFKRSNTEDYKNNTPVIITKEKSLESDVETAKHENRNTSKPNQTTTEIKTEIPSKNETDSLGIGNTIIVKTVITQKSIGSKELFNNPTTGTVKSENTSNMNDSTKCKIPVALNTKDGLETKISSAALNKHPTRVNVNDKISHKITDKQDEVTDKNMEKSHILQNVNHFEIEKFPKPDVKSVVGKNDIEDTETAENTSLRQGNKNSQIQNVDIKQQTETKTNNFDIPNDERVTNITKKEITPSENLSSPSDIKIMNIMSNKSVNEVSHLTENKQICHITEPENSNLISGNSKNKTDTPSNVKINQNKILNTVLSQNDNENTISTNKTSISAVKINQDDNKQDDKEIKENQTVKEPTASNIDAQRFQNVNESNISQIKDISNYQKDLTKNDKINYESKGIRIDNEQWQTLDKIELTLKSPIRTIINENNTNKEDDSNTQNITTTKITQENDNFTNQKQLFNTSEIKAVPVNAYLGSKSKNTDSVNKKEVNAQTTLEKENSYKLEELPVKNTSIDEKAEEDIIMLKGKVNRVIKRLDSKDRTTVKKEIDDVPKEVSVISKIAIFEKTELKDPLSKSNEDMAPLQQDVTNAKPKIVDEILKTDSQNEPNDADESVNKSAKENTTNNNKAEIRNDLEVRKDSKTDKTSDSKTKNILYDGKKTHRTLSSVNNEVFAKDNEQSSLEVWKEYRRKKEDSDMRRARSLAELDLGDAGRGRVRQLVVRMSSVDRGGVERGQHAGGRARPRGGAVSQRIAMYEGKLTATREHAARGDAKQPSKPPATEENSISEEELRSKIQELSGAKLKYGRRQDMAHLELADGGRMPALALGTAMLEPALLKHIIHAGIELGYRAIDCAYIYGNEREVGQAIRDKIQDGTVTRSELFIINKLWSTFHRRDLVQTACRQSLDAMGLDYFDLYLIHNPMSFKEGPNPVPKIAGVLQYSSHDYLEAWFGVEGLVSQGLARRGGLSNFNSQQVERVVDKARIKPVINQVESHPYLTQLRLQEFCSQRDVKLSCFGVLGSKGTPAELTSGQPPAIDDPLVQVMAAGLGVTPAQLLISYQLQLGRSVVVKCSSAAHLAQARAVAPPAASPSAPPVRLDASHLAALSALNRNKRTFTFKGMGDTHKNYPFRIPF